MRFFVSAALLTFSLGSPVFAHGSFAGGGVWNSSDGHSGTYTETVEAQHKDGDLLVNKTITVDDQVFAIAFTLRPVDDMRFKIIVGDKTVGGGYCWDVGSSVKASQQSQAQQSQVQQSQTQQNLLHGDKICHYGAQKPDGSRIENSLHISGDTIHEMGSDWNPTTKVHVTWKGAVSHVSED